MASEYRPTLITLSLLFYFYFFINEAKLCRTCRKGIASNRGLKTGGIDRFWEKSTPGTSGGDTTMLTSWPPMYEYICVWWSLGIRTKWFHCCELLFRLIVTNHNYLVYLSKVSHSILVVTPSITGCFLAFSQQILRNECFSPNRFRSLAWLCVLWELAKVIVLLSTCLWSRNSSSPCWLVRALVLCILLFLVDFLLPP